MRRFIPLSLGVLLLVTLISWCTSPPSLHAHAVLVGDLATVLVLASLVLYRVVHHRLSAVTSVVVVSLTWAVLATANAGLASSCPGNTAGISSRCTTKEVAAQATIGLLLPLIPLLFIIPLRAGIKAYRALHKVAVTALTKTPSTNISTPGPSSTSSSNSKRVTPKGTAPARTKNQRRRRR